MPTGLYFLFACLLLLLFLLLVRLRLSFIYGDDIRAYLQILFVKIPIYPKKEKVQIKDFSYKRLKKRKEKANAVAAKQPATKKKGSITEQIELFTNLITSLYSPFLRYFRLDVHRLRITVATGDAAGTAILYGAVSQALAYLLALLDRHTNLHPAHRADIGVYADFLGEKCTVDCNLTFSLRVYQLIHLGLKFARLMLTRKNKVK